MNLGTSSIGGQFTVSAGGNLTDSGISTVGDRASFTSTLNGGDITLDQLNVTGPILVTTTGTGGDATLVNAGPMAIGASTVTGNYSATASTGNLTDVGSATINGNATFRTLAIGADIILDALAVNGSIALNTTGAGADATVLDAGSMNLAASTIGGNLSATALSGNLTDSGAVVVAGSASLSAALDNADVVMDQLNVTGQLLVSTFGAGGNALISNARATNLGASTIGGELSVTSNGNLADAGAIAVGSTASFTTTALNADILLDQLSVAGPISLSTSGATGDATIVEASALNLGASTIGGNLTATSTTGNMTDSGTVAVGGNARFILSAAGADAVLDQLAVAGQIGFTAAGAGSDVTMTDSGSLTLGDSTIGGTLTATATGGDITDAGTLIIAGNAIFNASQTNADIVLDNLQVAGSVSANTTGTSGHVTLADSNLNLGTMTVSGNLTATSTGGDLTDSGIATVTGNAVFATSQADADIILDQLAVTGTIGLTTLGSGGNASITDAGSLTLGTSNIAGSLSATAAAGDLTDAGITTVAGAATFTTQLAGADILLDQAVITGPVSFNTTGTDANATYIAAGAVTLGASNVGGDLTVTTSSGNITDDGAVVAGTATFTTSQSGADIILDLLNVTGPISVNTAGSGGDVTLVDASDLILGGSVISGGLSATAITGTITDAAGVSVVGNSIFTTQQAGQFISVDNLAVNGRLAFNTTGAGADVRVKNAGQIRFNRSRIGGGIYATATTGNITDSARIDVAGTARFETRQNNATINLDNIYATGQIRLNTRGAGGDATILNNSTNVRLGRSTVGGDLRVTARRGNLSDAAPVRVNGDAIFTKREAAGAYDFDQLIVGGVTSFN
jgi:hypothetical protein